MAKVSRYFPWLILVGYIAFGIPCAYSETQVVGSGEFLGLLIVEEAKTIINNGTINGYVNVHSGCNLSIENRGTFNATSLTLGTGATITQLISQQADITTLNGITNYDVIVQNTSDVLSWSAITDSTVDANKFTLDNAKISLNNLDTVTSDIEIIGDVFVHINSSPNSDVLLFSDISGSGMIHVVVDGADPLYLAETNRVGGSVFVHVVRSGDYGRIMENDSGRFLNTLREKSPNDKLIKKIDAADSFKEVQSIMSKSVRLHPIKLMEPVRTFYSHKMLENMHIDDDFVFGVMPITVFSNDMFLVGIQPSAQIKVSDDLSLRISGHVLNLKFSDDINEYSGMSYGGGLGAVYKLPSNNFVRAYGDLSFSSFDTGLVFDGKGATQDPSGLSGYLASEFGHSFNFNNEYYVSPFVMLGTDFATILDSHDINMYAGVGANAGFGFELDGLKYDYTARGILRSDGGLGLGLKVSVWSIADSVGVDIGAGVFNDDIVGLSYNLALNAKISF